MDQRSQSIMEQAQHWVVEVNDPSFSSDRSSQAQFRHWLNRSATHADAFARWSQTFQRLGCPQALSEINLEDLILRYRCEQESGWRFRLRPWLSAAAALCLSVVLPLVPQQLRAAPTLYMTHVGEQRIVILPDGSTLKMNSGTRVLVQSAGHYREIDVLDGEAYFSLAPDGGRPIRVFAAADMFTGDSSEFDVLKYEGGLQVVAVRGQISVTSLDSTGAPTTAHILGSRGLASPNPFSLKAGEMATIRAQGKGPAILPDLRTPADIDRLLAWRNGLLAFSNQSAAEVVAAFNRYNGQQMAIADPDIADLRLSGDFQFADPQSFILALQRVYPTLQIVAQRQPTGAILLSRRSSGSQKSTQKAGSNSM